MRNNGDARHPERHDRDNERAVVIGEHAEELFGREWPTAFVGAGLPRGFEPHVNCFVARFVVINDDSDLPFPVNQNQTITSIRARCPGALASGRSQVMIGASIASARATYIASYALMLSRSFHARSRRSRWA